MIAFKYRSDVDGLRAVAVMLVLLYHAGLGFTGGYIGVDVFFVISGYLITGLILKECDDGVFSISGFWVRRIRRIVPASTCMAVVVLVAGYLLLLPGDFSDLCRSAVAQQFVISNFYFWRNTGYFDGPSDLKPLLHTWSLAVEEQFYLVYPLLLVLLHRYLRSAIPLVLSLFALGSLAISQYGVHYHPSAAFFLLPARAWELFVGGLIWFLPGPPQKSQRLLGSISWICLVAILYIGWVYTSDTLFPGLSAVVPCIATAGFIYANSAQLSAPAVVLATKPVVFVGLISYSLYLWHWPVLAFSRYWCGQEFGVVFRIVALVLCFSMAYASWKYIENPIRKSRNEVCLLRLVCIAIGAALLVSSVAYIVDVSDTVKNRLPEHVRKAAEPIDSPEGLSTSAREVVEGNLPVMGVAKETDATPDFLVWGDSHSMALWSCFNTLAKERTLHGVLAAHRGTIPVLGVWRPFYRREASESLLWNQAVMKYINDKGVKNVILVARWAAYVEGNAGGALESLIADVNSNTTDKEAARIAFDEGLSRTLGELESHDVSAWVLMQVPEQRFSPQRAIVRSLYTGTEIPGGVTLQEHKEKQSNAERIIIINVSSRENMRFVDLSENFFDERGISIIGDSRGSYYRDDDHVSELGAQELCRPLLDEILEEMQQSCKRE